MITVFIKYYDWSDNEHWAFDSRKIHQSKIVEVEKLTDLNDMFKNIDSIEIIKK